MRWGPLADHVRALRSVRVGREPAAEEPCLTVDWAGVARFRVNAMQLGERLPADDLATAAWGGLQDSAPRAALFALHARVDDVGPSAWEDASLAQIWLRWADYVVPDQDVGVFTRGALPRDADQRQAIEDLTDAIVDILDGRPRSPRELVAAMPDLPQEHWIRMTTATGKVRIRWDASAIAVLPADRPDIDDEAARLELARRFLRWLGPANHLHFAKWAGVSRGDGEDTWRALEGELVPVEVDGRARWLLATDEPALRGRQREADGVRLLPMGDPYLYLDRDLVVPAPPRHIEEWPLGGDVSQRLLNSLSGRVLVDGAAVASWGRAGGTVTVAPWGRLPDSVADRITTAVDGFETVLDIPITLGWLA